MTDNRLSAVRKEIYLASLSNENVEVPDVMNSNRKFYVSLVGTPLSHTTNSECLCFNSPCIIHESEHWKWPTSSFHFWRPGRHLVAQGPHSNQLSKGPQLPELTVTYFKDTRGGPYRKFCWNLTGVSSWIVCHIVIRQKQLCYWESFCAETLLHFGKNVQ